MIEQPLAVVCTGHGTHAVRELFVLVPVSRRHDLASIREDAGLPAYEDDSAAVLRGFGVAGSQTIVDSDGRQEKRKSDAQLVNTPGIGWQVAHRGCPSCGNPLVAPVAQLLAAASSDPRHAERLHLDVRPPRDA